MHGLPKDFDTSIFVGKALNLVCFAVNLTSFHFEREIRITSEGSLGYSLSPKDKDVVYQIPMKDGAIVELVGHAVSKAIVEGSGGLRLRFDNGHSLVFYDDKQNYESYHIQLGDKEIHI